jgi:predicted transposase YbfD/YdcC
LPLCVIAWSEAITPTANLRIQQIREKITRDPLAAWSGRLSTASEPPFRYSDYFLHVPSSDPIRGVTGSGKVEAEIRYFLSSCGDDPTVLIQAIRRPIENGLHWVLDVTFREDDSRVRDRTAARNLAILRKVAINLMGRDRTPRISMRARRKQAAWNDEYMLALLAG